MKGAGLAGAAALASDRWTAMLIAQEPPAAIRRDAARPAIEQGIASGDVTIGAAGRGKATIWSRSDRPARMFIEVATSDRFEEARQITGPAAIEATDFTAKTELRDLPAGQRVFYRVRWQDLRDEKIWSEPAVGSLVVPVADGAPARDITVAFTGDVCGQGWGIDRGRGGLKIFETMRATQPDLFIHLGDTIYADGPLAAEVRLDDGSAWRNELTEEKSHVAETLDDFRGNYKYNLLDEHVRRFHSEVSQLVLWDDHETHNNWHPGGRTSDERYRERASNLLAARARHAFLEYQPIRLHPVDRERIYRLVNWGPLLDVFAWDMRSYRGPNSQGKQTEESPATAILGETQLAWLMRSLAASRAGWKVIASDMPLGLCVPDKAGYEAVANRDDGPPLGRELEIARLLRFIKENSIQNVLFITADVHYAAAHHYDPARAKFTEFLPFWEFVAGPAHAGTFGPGQLDATFGPELKFLSLPPGMKQNRPPSEGLQFFGTLAIDADSRVLTVGLHNVAGKRLYSVELEPV